MRSLIRRLRTQLPPGGEPTDEHLLGEFVARRAEDAFAAIVRRHGPMVKGVCRRVLRNDADADGQVMMSEYMTEFTDSKAAEFAKYDLDGDGIITPEECLESGGSSGRR